MFQRHPHPKKSKNVLFPFFCPTKKQQFPQLFPPKHGQLTWVLFFWPRPDMSQHTGQCEMRVRRPGYFHCNKNTIFPKFSEPWDHEDVGEASLISHREVNNPKVRDVRRRDLPSYAVPVGDAQRMVWDGMGWPRLMNIFFVGPQIFQQNFTLTNRELDFFLTEFLATARCPCFFR